MTHYKCEEISPCESFSFAICLHCNRRLCLAHITEHNEGVSSSLQNLLNELEMTCQKINNQYEKSRETYNNVLTSLNHWRTQQTENIQQIYDYHLKLIESQQKSLNVKHYDLTNLLDRDAQQPLKLVYKQQNNGLEIINHIQETIKKVQKDCVQLRWNYSLPPLLNINYQPKDVVSLSKASMLY